MLFGRTANGLYWMNRYIERAENMARLVDAGLRMALTRTQSASEEWNSVLLSAGVRCRLHAEDTGIHRRQRRRFSAARHVEPVEHDVVDRDGPQQCPHGAHRADARDLGEHQRSLDVAEAHAGEADRRARPAQRARCHQARDGADPRLVLRHHAAQRDLRFLAARHLCRARRQHGAHPRREILRAAAVDLLGRLDARQLPVGIDPALGLGAPLLSLGL